MDEERPDGAELWQLIETLTEQVKSGRADIDALVARADASEVRADVSEVRLDDLDARERVDREMIAELQADGELSREHAKQMHQALRSSRVIGAAMGMIMASRQVSEDQAFAILSKASQDSNRKLREIAGLVVEGTAGHSATDVGTHQKAVTPKAD